MYIYEIVTLLCGTHAMYVAVTNLIAVRLRLLGFLLPKIVIPGFTVIVVVDGLPCCVLPDFPTDIVAADIVAATVLLLLIRLFPRLNF